MSGATPTLIPSPFIFPLLLPDIPRPFTLPLSRRRVYRHLNATRDLPREMDDLSDEENELDDEVGIPQFIVFYRLSGHGQMQSVSKRGFNFLVPIGRSLTQQEEKNDVSVSCLELIDLLFENRCRKTRTILHNKQA